VLRVNLGYIYHEEHEQARRARRKGTYDGARKRRSLVDLKDRNNRRVRVIS
jgi:hypothetical protein